MFFYYSRLGDEVKLPGEPCGSGLSVDAAAPLGLLPATPVSVSIIDAHAGTIGEHYKALNYIHSVLCSAYCNISFCIVL